MAIHGLPYGFMRTEADNLLPALAESIRNATGVGICSARFLQSDPAKRGEKSSGSVVVSVSPSDVAAFGSSIRLFSCSRQVERAYSSNPMTQCKFCFAFGHPAQRCRSDHAVCPICSLSHRRFAHQGSIPTCPKQGNAKAVPACCPASPLKCTNCQGEHLATNPECPSRPQPAQEQEEDPALGPRPTGDRMDESPDDAPPPPSTPKGRGPAIDLETAGPMPQKKEIAAPLPRSQAQLSRWAEDPHSSPTPHD